MDITEWLAIVKEKNLPFFLSFLYAVTNAANSVKEFRQRISADGQIIEFEKCLSSYTVALPDETYCYCQVDADMSYLEFLACAQAEQKKVLEEGSMANRFCSSFLCLRFRGSVILHLCSRFRRLQTVIQELHGESILGRIKECLFH